MSPLALADPKISKMLRRSRAARFRTGGAAMKHLSPETLLGAKNADYLLSILRVVSARIKLINEEVNSIGTALSRGLITPTRAIAMTEEAAPGCLDVVSISILNGVPE